MNGELAQLIGVATHASAALAGDAAALGAVGPEGQLFRWVAETTFLAPDGRRDVDAAGWVEGLRARGIERVGVVIPRPGTQTKGGLTIDERMLAGFTNSGTSWALATGAGAGAGEAWAGEWALGDREREDRRIWHVRYSGRAIDGVPTIEHPSVADALATLDAALRRASAFARRGDEWVAGWAEVFDGALAGGELPDLALLPASAPADARRLAGMAASSWVFGGMGSWNDVGFAADDPLGAEYESVSAELYAAVLGALAAAANA